MPGAIDPQSGYSLVEMTVAIAVLLIVSNSVFSGVLTLTDVTRAVHNRSEMHSGVRNATELLQQEVGQAGRVSLPGTVVLSGAIVAGTATVGVSSAEGMFVGEHLVVDTGSLQETVTLTAVDLNADTITATFAGAHAAGAPVSVHGGFASGVVPTAMADGSSGTVLKIHGDINADGSMVYVEYTCDTEGGNLYRNVMPFDTAVKPAVTITEVLLNNVLENPDGTPCFTYQERTIDGIDFVVQVAITLTVQTEEPDPITGLFQTETKALLNVSPRNVFHVWQLAGLGINNRVQPMPPSVLALLP
jgi:prepilin-type N-terminal cleavage/methylation domain-containing protein